MNRLFMRPFLVAICTTLLCVGPSVIFADEEEVPFPEIVRVEEENPIEDTVGTSPFTEIVSYPNDSYYLQRIHQDGYYHLVAISDNGDTVQLHDASKWGVERNGRQKVLNWVKNDDIFIKPSAYCCSLYKYVLHNRTTNQAVEVNLQSPPLPMGANTFRIVNTQPYDRLVLLSDNTVWQVSDFKCFSQWKIGQRVLVGVNNRWRTAPYPHFLINVDVPAFVNVEAIFYGYPKPN